MSAYAEAVKWFRLAAEQGNAVAQNNIGLNYVRGKGVVKDYSEAKKWFQLAAEQGEPNAQKHLGIMYTFGNGVIKDNLTAHMWFNIASANGGERAEDARDGVEAKMSAEDISKATAMARECMKSNYKKCGG